jgi:hypothetical protein
MPTRKCSDDSIRRSAEIIASLYNAAKANGQRPQVSDCYVPIWVEVVHAQAPTITLRARTLSGFSDEPWTWKEEMWVDCPSTLPFKADALPEVGAEGLLYLALEEVRKRNIQIPNLGAKWPLCYGHDDMPIEHASLKVYPTEIRVTGTAILGTDKKEVSIDLLNLNHAFFKQRINLDGGNTININLTRDGWSVVTLEDPAHRFDDAKHRIPPQPTDTSRDSTFTRTLPYPLLRVARHLEHTWVRLRAHLLKHIRPCSCAEHATSRDGLD